MVSPLIFATHSPEKPLPHAVISKSMDDSKSMPAIIKMFFFIINPLENLILMEKYIVFRPGIVQCVRSYIYRSLRNVLFGTLMLYMLRIFSICETTVSLQLAQQFF